ncbi:MAG: hypothetical protein LBE32_00700 [Burkholderiales bacterium]|jgi:hypothetical protein|nr:hypothetical protein [Burkholderiales bacterium]
MLRITSRKSTASKFNTMLPPPLTDGGAGGGGGGTGGAASVVALLLAGGVGAAGAGCALPSGADVAAARAARRSLLLVVVGDRVAEVGGVTLLSLLAADGVVGVAVGAVGGGVGVAGVAVGGVAGGVTLAGGGVSVLVADNDDGALLPLLTVGAGGRVGALLSGGVVVTGGTGSQGVWPLIMTPLPLKTLTLSSSSAPVFTRSTVSANACEYGTLLLLITSAVWASTSIGASWLAGTQEDNMKTSAVKRPVLGTSRFNCSKIIRFSL